MLKNPRVESSLSIEDTTLPLEPKKMQEPLETGNSQPTDSPMRSSERNGTLLKA